MSINPQEIEQMLVVNVMSTFFMTKVFMNRLSTRGIQSAVITISACAGLYPIPYWTLYSATKAFQLSYMQLLECENKNGKVDFITGCPMGVQTNILKISSNQSQALKGKYIIICQSLIFQRNMITPQHFARSMLNELRNGQLVTIGARCHKMAAKVLFEWQCKRGQQRNQVWLARLLQKINH